MIDTTKVTDGPASPGLASTAAGTPAAGPTAAETPAPSATDELAERLFAATLGTLELASVHLGARLGFYRALADHGTATRGELAARTGTAERYAREWLEQQAVAGLLSVDDPEAGPEARRYHLPTEHQPVLDDEESLFYLAPLARLAVGACGPMDALREAYRSGGGVAYERYGADIREGIAALNRPQFLHQVGDWLASVPEVDARLRARPPARVADLACGSAWSSIAIAQAYPEVTVDAVDVDVASIRDAENHINEAGLAERVRPRVQDASARLGGRYELVTIFEALHDMNHPVDVLRVARHHLAEGGSVVVADERVAERFTAPGDEVERFNYGWSVLHCLTVGMLDEDSAGTGGVMRPGTVRTYAAKAGFERIDVLPIEHAFWRFYRLLP